MFAKLANRLGLESVEIIKYAFYFNKKDPGVTKFVYRLQTNYFADIEPIYQSLLNYKEENPLLRQLLNVCIKKYEYLVRKITKEEYIMALEQNVQVSSLNEGADNIFVLFSRILYYEAVPANSRYSAESLAQSILKIDFRMCAFFYIIALDCLLYSIIGNDILSSESFRHLVVRFEEVLELVDIKPFHMQKTLYQAYISFLDCDKGKMDHFLFLYAINMSVLMGGENYRQAKTKVETLFHIDISEFLRTQSMDFGIPTHFVIE